jgi:hypothetical protein
MLHFPCVLKGTYVDERLQYYYNIRGGFHVNASHCVYEGSIKHIVYEWGSTYIVLKSRDSNFP